jgi:hypothetical protein
MAKIELIGAKMDWLRFTFREPTEQMDWCIDFWESQQKREADKEQPVEEIKLNNYYGLKSRHWFYGSRNDGHIFEVTSECAHTATLALKQQQFRLKVTRMDMAVDMLHEKELGKFTFQRRRQVRRQERLTNAPTRSTIAIVEAPGRGDSITIGTRKTGEVLVNYDKDAEQEFALGAPIERTEARTGRDRATKVWRDVLECEDLEQFCLDVVVARYRLKGIKLAVGPMALPYDYPNGSKPKSTEEQTADWLVKCAAKAFRKIQSEELRRQVAAAFGLGYRKRIEDDGKLSKEARAELERLSDWREARLEGMAESAIKRD